MKRCCNNVLARALLDANFNSMWYYLNILINTSDLGKFCKQTTS